MCEFSDKCERGKSKKWRTERDLNPRYPIRICTLSRGVVSATHPSVRLWQICNFCLLLALAFLRPATRSFSDFTQILALQK